MKINISGRSHKVYISDHILDKRENETKSRGFNYNEDEIDKFMRAMK